MSKQLTFQQGSQKQKIWIIVSRQKGQQVHFTRLQ